MDQSANGNERWDFREKYQVQRNISPPASQYSKQTPLHGVTTQKAVCYVPHATFMLSLALSHEDGGHCVLRNMGWFVKKLKTKLLGLSPRANYTDRATAACRRSDCQLFADRGYHVVSVTDPSELPPLVGEVIANFLRIEGITWSAWRIPTAVFSIF
jgi:hypothetical protein